MDTALSIAFVAAAGATLLFACLALFGLGSVRLHSIVGILRDGPKLDSPLPAMREFSGLAMPECGLVCSCSAHMTLRSRADIWERSREPCTVSHELSGSHSTSGTAEKRGT